MFYSLNYLQPVHVKNIHLLPQYTPNNDVEQSDIPPGLLSVELLFLLHRPFNTSCTVPSTLNLSRILVIVTVVGGGVPNSTLQRRWTSTNSPLSNNTSITTYDHRMIISPLFVCLNTCRTMDVLLCFSSAFWIIQNKNCISLSFRCWEITFQRVYTSIWNTPYYWTNAYPIYIVQFNLSYSIFKICSHQCSCSLKSARNWLSVTPAVAW